MIVEILLGLIVVALAALGACLYRIERRLVEWRVTWDSLPPIATDYYSREIMHITQEIAHYIALRPWLRPDNQKATRKKRPKMEQPNSNGDAKDLRLL